MTEAQIEETVNIAMRSLRWDDANPNVGMGLFISTAVEQAIVRMRHLATIFETTIEISDAEVEKIDEIVLEKR